MSNAGETIGATVGAIAGFSVGGFSGAAKGASLGYSFMHTEEKTESRSPRYSFDKPKNTASSTRPIPIVYGRNLVTGNIIYKEIYGEKNLYH